MGLEFRSLDEDELQRFELICNFVRSVRDQPDGRDMLLNALCADDTGESQTAIEEWAKGIAEVDPRDLAAFTHAHDGRIMIHTPPWQLPDSSN